MLDNIPRTQAEIASTRLRIRSVQSKLSDIQLETMLIPLSVLEERLESMRERSKSIDLINDMGTKARILDNFTEFEDEFEATIANTLSAVQHTENDNIEHAMKIIFEVSERNSPFRS
jgi:hypothetical protein